MTIQRTLLTADELFWLPDDGSRRELPKGEVRTMAPAGGEHGLVAGEALLLIGNHVRSGSLGVVLAAETGFRIGRNPDTVRAPDVAFVAAGRFPGGRPPASFPDLAPDIAVEVSRLPTRPARSKKRSRIGCGRACDCSGWFIRPPAR